MVPWSVSGGWVGDHWLRIFVGEFARPLSATSYRASSTSTLTRTAGRKGMLDDDRAAAPSKPSGCPLLLERLEVILQARTDANRIEMLHLIGRDHIASINKRREGGRDKEVHAPIDTACKADVAVLIALA